MWSFTVYIVAIVFSLFNIEALILSVPRTNLQPIPFNLSASQNTMECGGNMVKFTSGDNEIFCGCPPGLLFYAEDSQCYEPYSQGPCPAGQHLIYELIDQDTFTVQCKVPHFRKKRHIIAKPHFIYAQLKQCPKNYKRNALGICKPLIPAE